MAIPFSRGWMLSASHGVRAGGFTLPLGLFTGGVVITYAPPAGIINNVNPGGAWPLPSVGRIDVDTTAGNSEWTGLLATATDGQGVLIRNIGANLLQLDELNAGSLAANQFDAAANVILTTGQTFMAVYYLAAALWVLR